MLTVDTLIAVLAFGLTCFSVGYMIGRRNDRPRQGNGRSDDN